MERNNIWWVLAEMLDVVLNKLTVFYRYRKQRQLVSYHKVGENRVRWSRLNTFLYEGTVNFSGSGREEFLPVWWPCCACSALPLLQSVLQMSVSSLFHPIFCEFQLAAFAFGKREPRGFSSISLLSSLAHQLGGNVNLLPSWSTLLRKSLF